MQESWSSKKCHRAGLAGRCVLLACVVLRLNSLSGQAAVGPQMGPAQLQDILSYIHTGWNSLTRSTTSCSGIADPKLPSEPLLYLPAGFSEPAVLKQMERECGIKIGFLPQIKNQNALPELDWIQPPGLLYLQHQYVVPGGRFNEMYGWDSYFIIRGLLRDGRIDLARGMVENFFFEIEHYGALLNANRTYYLTRSQPPFLSSMVMAVHQAQIAAGQDDHAWMERAYDFVKRDHDMWTRGPHLAGNTDLSRYYDFGEGPAMEALQDENDIYRQVAAYFLVHPTVPPLEAEQADVVPGRASGSAYAVKVCSVAPDPASCEPERLVKLKPEYYRGDRSMRESGFDISFRFGAFGARTPDYAPVCLNSLLFKAEEELAEMSRLLGKTSDAVHWQKLASERQVAIRKYLWDDKRGLFLDYDFKANQRSDYLYATTFYPLWVGLASHAEAQAVMNNLHVFEQPGGIVMSLRESQGQWDYPFGWAPIQLLAIEGMRRYGYNSDADRVSSEFLTTVLLNFERDRTIREKYNVVTRSSEIQVTAGYSANVIGFGWTNATFVELLNSLPRDKVSQLTAGHASVAK